MTFILGFISGIIFLAFIKLLSRASFPNKSTIDFSRTQELIHQTEYSRLIPGNPDFTSTQDPESLPDISKISKIKPIFINKIN